MSNSFPSRLPFFLADIHFFLANIHISQCIANSTAVYLLSSKDYRILSRKKTDKQIDSLYNEFLAYQADYSHLIGVCIGVNNACTSKRVFVSMLLISIVHQLNNPLLLLYEGTLFYRRVTRCSILRLYTIWLTS